MEYQDITISRGTAPRLRIRLITPPVGGVATWTVLFECRLDEKDDSAVVYSTNGFITDPSIVPNSTALGVWDVALSVADSRLFTIGRTYYFRFKRTDVGNEDVFVRGKMQVV